MGDKAIPVRVAIRIRPLVPKEVAEGSQQFVNKVLSQPQVTIKGSNEAFTFDYVFDPLESQAVVYDSAVSKIVGKIFKGYNVRRLLTFALCWLCVFRTFFFSQSGYHPRLRPNRFGKDAYNGHRRHFQLGNICQQRHHPAGCAGPLPQS